MKKQSRGLFDEQIRLDKLTAQNDPLVKLVRHIDFEFFRIVHKGVVQLSTI